MLLKNHWLKSNAKFQRNCDLKLGTRERFTLYFVQLEQLLFLEILFSEVIERK